MYVMNKPYTWFPGLIFLHMGYKDSGVTKSISARFKSSYKESWFEDEFNIRVVTELDKTTMIVPGVFRSPWLGNINHLQISGGAKGIILLNSTDGNIVPLASFGENCMDLIYELSQRKEIHFYYEGYFPNYAPKGLHVLDVEKSIVFTGEEAWDWERLHAPYEPKLYYEPYNPGAGQYVEEGNCYV